MLVERKAIGHAGNVVGNDARRSGASGAINLQVPFRRQALRLGEEEPEDVVDDAPR